MITKFAITLAFTASMALATNVWVDSVAETMS